MKKTLNTSMLKNMMTEFSDQLGINGKSKSNMGRNMAMIATGILGFSMLRRMMRRLMK